MAANWVDANPFFPSRRPKIAMTVYAFSLLFAAVLANQAGVPIPVVPYLVATGVLAAHAGTGGMHYWCLRGFYDAQRRPSTVLKAAFAVIRRPLSSAVASFPS